MFKVLKSNSTVFALLLFVLCSCSKNIDKPFSIENYKQDLELCYKKGEIDSAQKVLLDKYILRSYNWVYHSNFEENPKEYYKQFFCDSLGNFLSYKKLMDSIVALDRKDFPLRKVTTAMAVTYPKDGTFPYKLKEGKVSRDGFYPEDYELKDSIQTRELTAGEIQELLDGMNGYWPSERYTEFNPAACYMPHYGIFLYNEKKEVEAYIEICFTCGAYRIFPEEIYGYRNREKNKLNPPIGDMSPFRKVFTEAK